MANEYNIISDEALDALCGAIKGIANAGEIVDDTGVAMDKTYSSFKIQEELDKKIEGDNVVKKDDIVTVLDDTVTDEQIPSAKVVVDELNTKANDSEVVKKTDIVTTINSTSTDDTVPSTKTVYSVLSSSLKSIKIMYFEFGGDFNYDNLGVNSTNTITEVVRAFANYIKNNYGNNQYVILEFTASSSHSVFSQSLPNNKQACIGSVKYTPWKHTSRVQVILTDVFNGNSYIGTLNNSDTNDIVWKRLCATTVADVSKKNITLSDTTNYSLNNGFYSVKNGMCEVQMSVKCITPQTTLTALATLPTPANSTVDVLFASSNGSFIQATISNGNLYFRNGVAGGVYLVRFVYSVAEE